MLTIKVIAILLFSARISGFFQLSAMIELEFLWIEVVDSEDLVLPLFKLLFSLF